MELNIYSTYEDKNSNDPLIGKLIFDKYKIIKRLGGGTFGSIYSAFYDNKYYALKFEVKKGEKSLLENECYIMNILKSPYLPSIKVFGYNNTHNILVMELMGKSLENIFEETPKKFFSTRCVCNIGYQMIEILEFIHNKNYIHRDIKPDNFVIGLNHKKKYIFILDFGLSTKYKSSKTNKHYPPIVYKNLVGTPRYASINALGGLTQSRRDDLESVGYVLLYFLKGRLPWQGIPAKNKEERYKKIMEKKKYITPEELCEGYHQNFSAYVKYVRNLEYEQDPDYDYLKSLFLNILKVNGYHLDCFYDWDTETIIYKRNQNKSFNSSMQNYSLEQRNNNNSNVFAKNDNIRPPSFNNNMSAQKNIGSDVYNYYYVQPGINNKFFNTQNNNNFYNNNVSNFNNNIIQQQQQNQNFDNYNNNYKMNGNYKQIYNKNNKNRRNCECCNIF